MNSRYRGVAIASLAGVVWLAGSFVSIAQAQAPRREFGEGRPFNLGELPRGRFRDSLERLPQPARDRAMAWLHSFRFPAEDAASLHADPEGGIFYVDPAGAPEGSGGGDVFPAGAAIPVSPFPDSLKFHSRPGATNVIILDFDGHIVTGTAWNSSLGRTVVTAVVFNTDADATTYSDAEQLVIKRVWQRVAEDYAPFDVDVTTEEPAVLNSRTARALITRNTDAGGLANPSSSAGGVAYVGVFGGSLAYYSPAWVYYNNLGSGEGNIAEAATHEIGHNMGLSHDGKTDGTEYYYGHGAGDVAWAPHMGVGYGKNVSQWSMGEYYLANNTQDDLAIIAGKLRHRADDFGNTIAAPGYLNVAGGSNVFATTPETDPGNLDPSNKGVLESGADSDVLAFTSGGGTVSLTVRPWISPAGTRGGNTDLRVRLLDASGNLIVQDDPTSRTYATVSAVVTAGIYYLAINAVGTGDPFNTAPSGYTAYASAGQYFITGRVVTSSGINFPPQAALDSVTAPAAGQTDLLFSVVYSDNAAIDVSTLGAGDTRVDGPNGFIAAASLVSVDNLADGTPRTATYRVTAPGGAWDTADNGIYTFRLNDGEVGDIEGSFAGAAALGATTCDVPVVVYSATMSTNPAWSLQGPWAYGVPSGTGNDPSSGYSGAQVVGVNLNGTYTRTQGLAYATTPPINCAGAGTVTLRYRRWLGVRNNDSATVQVSPDGQAWTTIWSSSGNSFDTSWQDISFNISAYAAGRTNAHVRWGIAANGDNQVSFGWNLDDVQLTATMTSLPAQAWTLVAQPSDPARGSVTPTGGVYDAGTPVSLTAVASNYFRFAGWSGALGGTQNPAVVAMDGNKYVTALFEPVVTSNNPTPVWWLVQNGYTDDFEQAVQSVGANGMPVWASYIAGLAPGDAGSVFGVGAASIGPDGQVVLRWTAASGRVYSVHCTAAPDAPFAPVPGAVNLAWPVNAYTAAAPAEGCLLYQLRVRLP